MAAYDATATRSTQNFEALPSGKYRAKIVRSEIREDTLAKPNADGTKPLQFCIVWEITAVSPEQSAEGATTGAWVWDQGAFWYGNGKGNVPSRFKERIDVFLQDGVRIDPRSYDPDALVDLEYTVEVTRYKKTKGVNIGQWGNKVAEVFPNNRQPRIVAAPVKNAPQPIEALPQTAIIAGYVDDIRPATPYGGKRATSFRFTTRAGEAFYFVTTELARSDLQDDQDDSADDPENVSEIEYYTDSNGVNVATKWVCRAKPF